MQFPEMVEAFGEQVGEHREYIGMIPMPEKIKAREFVSEKFGSRIDEDGTDANLCMAVIESFMEWQEKQRAALASNHDDDFAKIVRASNGQQVLFYLEDSGEDGNTMHCMAVVGDAHADLKFGGLPNDAFAAALSKADVKMADQVLAHFGALGLSST